LRHVGMLGMGMLPAYRGKGWEPCYCTKPLNTPALSAISKR
jgi:hypothetical protein